MAEPKEASSSSASGSTDSQNSSTDSCTPVEERVTVSTPMDGTSVPGRGRPTTMMLLVIGAVS